MMQAKDIKLGYVAFTPKGKWDSAAKYDRYNLVIHNSSVWYAKVGNENAEPKDGSEAWGLMVDGEPINDAVAKAETDVNAAIEKAETDVAAAVRKAETAAGNVNAELVDDVLTVTDAKGAKKSLDLASAAEAAEAIEKAGRSSLALGHYTDRGGITLTAVETGVAVSADGVKVSKSGWAIAEFTAEKGNEYLFKPGETDGGVCVFAEYIDKVEDRAIDYTYTYNTDGTTATAQATYGGKTYKYTYTYDADGKATIKDSSGTAVASLPLLYTTTAGTYSPLVRLNADAELPEDGYCRFMSHFQGNSALKVVVSYKVGSADLEMKVLRDGVFASISTQLGNLSQKQSDTASEVAKLTESYVEVRAKAACTVSVDGKNVTLEPYKMTRVYPKLAFYAQNKNIANVRAGRLDTSGFTNMSWMFNGCSSLQTLDVSGWDTSKVTDLAHMFYGCSSLQTLDVSGWDTSKVTKMNGVFESVPVTTLDVSGWDTSKVTTMGYMFRGCSKLTKVDVSNFDTSNVTVMAGAWSGMFQDCSSLQTLDVSGWDVSKVTDLAHMFNQCRVLQGLDLSGWVVENCTSFDGMCGNNKELTTLIGAHTLAEVESGEVVALKGARASLSFTESTKLDRKSLLAVIKGLADLTGQTGQTLSLGSTLKAKLTSDDIAVATGKNWTVV